MKIKKLQIEGKKYNCEMSITADTADVFVKHVVSGKPIIMFKELKLTDLDELSEIFSAAYYEVQREQNAVGKES